MKRRGRRRCGHRRGRRGRAWSRRWRNHGHAQHALRDPYRVDEVERHGRRAAGHDPLTGFAHWLALQARLQGVTDPPGRVERAILARKGEGDHARQREPDRLSCVAIGAGRIDRDLELPRRPSCARTGDETVGCVLERPRQPELPGGCHWLAIQRYPRRVTRAPDQQVGRVTPPPQQRELSDTGRERRGRCDGRWRGAARDSPARRCRPIRWRRRHWHGRPRGGGGPGRRRGRRGGRPVSGKDMQANHEQQRQQDPGRRDPERRRTPEQRQPDHPSGARASWPRRVDKAYLTPQ